MTLWSLCSALALATAAGAGAEPSALTLDQALQEAQEHAPNLRASAANVGVQQADLRGQRATFLPKLSLYAGYTPLFAFATEATGATSKEGVVALKSPLSEVGAAVAFPAFDGLQNVYQRRALRLQLHAAQNLHSWEAFVLTRLVRYRYREVQAAISIERAACEQVKSLESHLQQVTSMLGQRAATQFDQLRVQVRLEEAKTELLQAQDAIVVSRRTLQEAMGLEHDTRPLTGTLPDPVISFSQHVAALDSEVMPARLDIEALAALQGAQQALREAAQKFWLPKVDVVGNVNRYNNWDRSIHRNGLYNNAYLVGFRLRMNIFDGLASSSAAQAAAMQHTRLQEQQRAAILQQSSAILVAQRGYLTSEAQFKARTLNITRAETNLKLAFSGYTFGTRNSTDLLDAQADLFGARADAVRAHLAMEEHKVALELALGQEL